MSSFFLNVQNLLQVVDFFLQENIIQNDDDTFVADVVIKCLKKQIDAIENYTMLYSLLESYAMSFSLLGSYTMSSSLLRSCTMTSL